MDTSRTVDDEVRFKEPPPRAFLAKTKRMILAGAGTTFLAIGIIGLVIPLLPTTPFLLLAVACYVRSSRRMYEMLTTNRIFGRHLTNYLQGGGATMPAKLLAISSLWACILASVLFISNTLIQVILLIVALAVTAHLVALRTLPAS